MGNKDEERDKRMREILEQQRLCWNPPKNFGYSIKDTMKSNKTVEVTEKWLQSIIDYGKQTSDLLMILIDNDKLTSSEVGLLSRFTGQAMSAEHLIHDHCDPERDLHGDLIVKPNIE